MALAAVRNTQNINVNLVLNLNDDQQSKFSDSDFEITTVESNVRDSIVSSFVPL